MNSISVVVFDTRLLRESRSIEIDFVKHLVLYYRRPGQWALSSPVFPKRRVDARKSSNASSVVKCLTINVMTGMLETNQLEYCSRLCEKELKRSGFDVECVMLYPSPRKIRMRLEHVVWLALSGVAIDPQPDEQVECQDLTGDLSNSLSEIRKETHSWKNKVETSVRQSQTKVIDSRVLSRA